MSVILNEAGIQRLFSNPEGIIGREIGRLTQQVTIEAQKNVDFIMHRNPVGAIGYNLREGVNGVEGVVGVFDGGDISDYLDEKAAAPKEGNESWMLKAMRTVFP